MKKAFPSFVSFRDPAGFCFTHEDKVFRAISPEALVEIEPFLNSATAGRLIARQDLVSSRRLDSAEQEALQEAVGFRQLANGQPIGAVFQHERIAFASYPYEWAPEMLYAAGELTLDLAQSCLKENYCLKDASPYNILFRGGAPVFIDVLSFERRSPRDPIWKPYAQFCRNFLLPLLANKTWGIRLADVFNGRRDGIEPAEIYRLCGPVQKLVRPYLSLVSVPAWLARKKTDPALYRDRLLKDPEKARFILNSSLNRLRRLLRSVRPKSAKSFWAGYAGSHSYPDSAFRAKEDFLRNFLQEARPKRILDVGANTGHFSALAARAGAEVVAVDSDAGCAGALWQRARSEKLAILPLVVDFSRPSPAQGWRNREHNGFLDRAAGAFDTVMMFGLLHHLLVTERIPLREILELAAALAGRWLLVEFIAPQDKMFRILTRGRDALHADLTAKSFEAECENIFAIAGSGQLPGMDRHLYVLKKKV